jgi:two-component system cell cycle sensor histidine kinase/response regulator CckA
MVAILLAEDVVAIRDLTQRILEGEGHEVLPAADGTEATQVLAERPDVEILVTDASLPGRSGVELAEEIVGRSPSAFAILMSGYDEGTATRGRGLPERTTFLQKPFSPLDLAEAIAARLDSGS